MKASTDERIPPESFDALVRSIDQTVENSDARLIESSQRDKAIEALFLRSAGYSVAEVKRRTGLHHMTIAGLEERHADVYKILKKKTAMGAALAAEKSVQLFSKKIDQLSEDPEALAKVNVKDVAIAAGVAIDKKLTLTGEASEIHVHKHSFSFEDYQESLRKAKGRVVNAEATNQEKPADTQHVIGNDEIL